MQYRSIWDNGFPDQRLYLEIGGCALLDARCKEIFTAYIDREYGDSPLDIKEALSLAFEQGAQVAKRRGDASSCPYSAVSDPEPFLAWVEGFNCCSVR